MHYHQSLFSSLLSGGFLSQLQEAPKRPKKGNSKKDIQVIPLGVAFYFSALASPPLLSPDQGQGAVPQGSARESHAQGKREGWWREGRWQ